MSERQNRTIRVHSVEQYDTGFPDEATLPEFIAWLSEALSEVPEEYRAKTEIEISASSRYDSSYATIEISYRRPETDEEWGIRTARENGAAIAEVEHLSRQLENAKTRLKATDNA